MSAVQPLTHTYSREGFALRRAILLILFACMLVLSGCAASTLAISKRNLNVQTRMTATIFLDPVSPDKRIVYVEVRNTSDKPDFDVEPAIAAAIVAKGYTRTYDPDEAQYLLQVNVLQVGMVDPSAAEMAFAGGYGGALDGFLIGSAVSNIAGGGYRTSTGFGLVGGIIGMVANAAVKDVTYSIITDIQISERARQGVIVNEANQAVLQQGTSGSRTVTSNEVTEWKRYQTRIMSTANKVNLKFEDAVSHLIEGLVRSISGIL